MIRRFPKFSPIPEELSPTLATGAGYPIAVFLGVNNSWGVWTASTPTGRYIGNFVAYQIVVGISFNKASLTAPLLINPVCHFQLGLGPAGSERVVAQVSAAVSGNLSSVANSDSGTATGSTATTMTDTTQKWAVDVHKTKMITMGGSTATVTSNTATVLTFSAWAPLAPVTGTYVLSGAASLFVLAAHTIPIKPTYIPAGELLSVRGLTEDSQSLVPSAGITLVGYDADNIPPLLDMTDDPGEIAQYLQGKDSSDYSKDSIYRNMTWPTPGSGVAGEGVVTISPLNTFSVWTVAIPENKEPYPLLINGVTTSHVLGTQQKNHVLEIGLSEAASGEMTYSRCLISGGTSSLNNASFIPLARPLVVPAGWRVSLRAKAAVVGASAQQYILNGERIGG